MKQRCLILFCLFALLLSGCAVSVADQDFSIGDLQYKLSGEWYSLTSEDDNKHYYFHTPLDDKSQITLIVSCAMFGDLSAADRDQFSLDFINGFGSTNIDLYSYYIGDIPCATFNTNDYLNTGAASTTGFLMITDDCCYLITCSTKSEDSQAIWDDVLLEIFYPGNNAYAQKSTVVDVVDTNMHNQEDTSLIRLFVEYGTRIREVSFRELDEFITSSGFKYDRTVPTTKEFGTHHIYDEHGSTLCFSYMPIDSSFDSKDFGNIDKEKLCSVQLSKDERSISISDDMHTKETACTIYNKNDPSPRRTVLTIKQLLKFYESEMGGVVPSELMNASLGVSDSYRITQSVESRAKEYFECSLKDVQVTIDNSSGTTKYIVMVYINWDINKKLDYVNKYVTMYSDDLSAYLADHHDNVSQLHVFWTIPKHYGNEIAAKNSYTMSGGHAYVQSRFGFLYQK